MIGIGCYLTVNIHVGAYVNIEDNVLVDRGAIIVSSKVKLIGKNSIIGAGSVVINNVEDSYGKSYKIIKKDTINNEK